MAHHDTGCAFRRTSPSGLSVKRDHLAACYDDDGMTTTLKMVPTDAKIILADNP
jgi:hypothetical protein